MKTINFIVLVGFAILGGLLAAGYLLQNGGLEVFAAYSGWFLTTYSMFAYAFAAVHHLWRSSERFWSTLYPVNLALALVAVSLFGLHDARSAISLAVFGAIGAMAGVLTARSTFGSFRALPLIALLPLCLCLLPIITPHWTLLFAAVAAYLLASYADVRFMRRTGVDI